MRSMRQTPLPLTEDISCQTRYSMNGVEAPADSGDASDVAGLGGSLATLCSRYLGLALGPAYSKPWSGHSQGSGRNHALPVFFRPDRRKADRRAGASLGPRVFVQPLRRPLEDRMERVRQQIATRPHRSVSGPIFSAFMRNSGGKQVEPWRREQALGRMWFSAIKSMQEDGDSRLPKSTPRPDEVGHELYDPEIRQSVEGTAEPRFPRLDVDR
jgi:hypothetical protein